MRFISHHRGASRPERPRWPTGSLAKRADFTRRTSRAILVVLVVVTCLSFLVAEARPVASAEASSAASTHYDIKAKLDYGSGTLTASEVVSYVNNVGQPLDSLVFNVTPAYFGVFQLRSVTVAGQDVQPSLKGVVLEVPLAQPLAPAASIEVQIDFSETVPAPGNMRFGRASGIIALGNWYPVLSVWRDPGFNPDLPVGWSRHPYVDTGDAFFTATADYDVSLDLNTTATIAHSGDLIRHEGSQWVFHASNVRDFALAISPRFVTKSTVVGNTTVTAFYLPEHESAGQQYLNSAAESLAWFNATLGAYPYATMQVAETNTNDPGWVGQEYPNVVFISNQVSAAGGGVGSYLDYLVVHENCHQWFYGLVGNDQLYEPWVDEASVTYVTYMYFRANYPQVYQTLWRNALNNLEVTKQTWGDRAVNSSIYDYKDENYYFGIVYRKGAVFLDELRKMMGDDAFFAFLRQYVQAHTFGIASAREYLNAAQASAPASIAPLVSRFFSYTDYDQPTPAATAPTPAPTVTATPASTPTATGGTATVTATPSPPPSPSPEATPLGTEVAARPSPTLEAPTAQPAAPTPTQTAFSAVVTPSVGLTTPAVDSPSTPSSGIAGALTDQVATIWPVAIPVVLLIGVGLVVRSRRGRRRHGW